MERIKIHGTALEGNLEGNAAERDALVFLPPSYAKERSQRYPVVYALHGYSIGAEQWSREIHVPQTFEVAFAQGAADMKAWQGRSWSWNIDGLSLHSYTVVKWPPSYKSTGFGETEYAQILKSTLEMEDLVARHSAIMDKYDPQKKLALVVDESGAWYAPLPGAIPAFWSSRTACATPSSLRST